MTTCQSVIYDSELPFFNVPPNQPRGCYIVNAAALRDQFKLWSSELPTIQPYYAVKTNPDPFILRHLAQLGCNFDCASLEEITQVLALSVNPERILFAHPVKVRADFHEAFALGVTSYTFDSVEELDKVPLYRPGKGHLYQPGKVVLRLAIDNQQAKCCLTGKFGATLEDVPAILMEATHRDIPIMGVSFHVGSGCYTGRAFDDALLLASKIFHLMIEYGHRPTILDIGGGFLAEAVSFREMAQTINKCITKYFPGIKVIAEPGRFFAEPCMTLLMPVIGVRQRKGKRVYTVPEGVYSGFNCLFFDHAQPRFTTAMTTPTAMSSIYGPTCDSLDCLAVDIEMPVLNEGDFLIFPQMGAYTTAASSSFNGFSCLPKVYVD